MQKQSLCRAAIGTLLCASFLFAQHSTTPPTATQIVATRVARLTTLLNLTTAQQSHATTIFTTAQNTISGLATAQSTARAALQAAVLVNDTNAITTQATQLGSLATQAIEAEAAADAAFYQLLTADQQTTYKTILTQDPQLLLGPGGPGGPGGHPSGH